MYDLKKVWPNSRRAGRVFFLHEQPLSTIDSIPYGGTVVDLGMGSGNFLIDLRKQRRDLNLIGVSASPVEIRNHTCTYANISVIRGALPHDPSVIELLHKNGGTADRIYDTYGPHSYSGNPIHCLIFAAILLKNGGIFSAITGTEGFIDTTVFGGDKTQKKLIDFFKNELDITLNFSPKEIQSEVTPGKIMTDFRVSFTKGNKLLHADDYFSLCKKADKAIGFVKKVPSVTDALFQFGKFRIDMKEYETFQYYNKQVLSR